MDFRVIILILISSLISSCNEVDSRNSMPGNGLSRMLYRMNDREIINYSSDIIEGEVKKIVNFSKDSNNKCFNAVYTIQVTTVFKGEYLAGDNVKIGTTNDSYKLELNKTYLGAFRKQNPYHLNECSLQNFDETLYPDLIDLRNISFLNANIYEIYNGTTNKRFRLKRCDEDRALFGEDKELYQTRNPDNNNHNKCEYYEGFYSVLIGKLNNMVKSLK